MYAISREQGVISSVALAGVAALGTTAAQAQGVTTTNPSWSDIYFGGQASIGEQRNQYNHPVIRGGTGDDFGGIGLTVGADLRLAPRWVIGGRFYFDGTAGTGSPNSANGVIIRATSDYDYGVAARLGYLVDPTTLMYGTAGYEWKPVTVTLGTATDTHTTGNFTIGAGVEKLISRDFSLVAEVVYETLNSDANYFNDLPARFHDCIRATFGFHFKVYKLGESAGYWTR
jgi:outer membrane immunogenic protein